MWDMVVGCELCGAEIAHHCKVMDAPSYIFPYLSLRIVPSDIHSSITLVWCAYANICAAEYFLFRAALWCDASLLRSSLTRKLLAEGSEYVLSEKLGCQDVVEQHLAHKRRAGGSNHNPTDSEKVRKGQKSFFTQHMVACDLSFGIKTPCSNFFDINAEFFVTHWFTGIQCAVDCFLLSTW